MAEQHTAILVEIHALARQRDRSRTLRTTALLEPQVSVPPLLAAAEGGASVVALGA
jgi:hypothetical protein